MSTLGYRIHSKGTLEHEVKWSDDVRAVIYGSWEAATAAAHGRACLDHVRKLASQVSTAVETLTESTECIEAAARLLGNAAVGLQATSEDKA